MGPQQAFNTSTSPNEQSNQQSRRGSLLESQQTRISNQSNIGRSPTEIVGSSPNEFQTSHKYMQDSFETEKYKSNRSSPTIRSSGPDRKGSLRFYDDSSNFADKERDEPSPTEPQNASMYEKNEFKYNDSPQEYDQMNQIQTQSQKPFYDTQIDYRGQSHNAYETEHYNDSQYNDQQNYDGIQYGVQQPASQYEYQPEYQEYDTEQQIYQANNPPPEPLQPEQQYETDIYQERATKPTQDTRTVQQYQNFSESNSSTPNMGQKNGNGNITNKPSNTSKQSTAKKLT